MPKVCWLCEYPTLNGGERSLLATACGLRREGFEIACIAPSNGPLAAELQSRDIDHLPLDFHDAGKRLPGEALRGRLATALLRCRPDVLHANSLSMGRLAGPVVADLGLPGIAHLRDIMRLSRRAIVDLNRNDRLLAVSHATREYHLVQGFEAARTHVLYNGVDLDRFRPRQPKGYLHRELSLPGDARLVGTIGQIVQRKGIETLVAAARRVVAKHDRVHFLLVGSRYSKKAEALRYEQDLRLAFSTGKLAGRAHLLGLRPDVDRVLGELTILVHAARQEPLGRVLLEAAASGTPVVATNVGGTAEIFPSQSGTAMLVPRDDPQTMAAAIGTLLTSKARRKALGKAARLRAEALFNIEAATTGLARHYRQVISRRQDDSPIRR